MSQEKIICSKCGKLRQAHGKEICNWCYRRYFWKRKLITCKRCKRQKPNHVGGLCSGCYNMVFNLEKTKDYNHQKRHNISPELYHQITQSCLICGFNKFVELHHVDCNRHNNSAENMIGLCPNHHKMLHTLKWREEVLTQIRKALLEKELPQTLRETDAPTDESQAPAFQILTLPIKNKLNMANAC